jgi:hypothetical protein
LSMGVAGALMIWTLSVSLLPREIRRPFRDALAQRPMTPEEPARTKRALPLRAGPVRSPAPALVLAPAVQGPKASSARATELIAAPSGLGVLLLSPDHIRLEWEPLGSDYRYLVYASETATMLNAHQETAQPIPRNWLTWTPSLDAASIWLAVKAVSPSGLTSDFSDPILVRMR